MQESGAARLPERIELVMLDCDGVLFESCEANVAYYDAILSRLDRPPLNELQRELAHRLSTGQLFEHVFEGDAALLERSLSVACEIGYAPFFEQMTPMPGLFEVLDTLRRSWRTAMVTNRSATIVPLLERFGLAPHFDAVVGLCDVTRPKPAPDMVELCLARLGVEPARAVYVGDSPTDGMAARAAGVRFIGLGAAVAGEEHWIAGLDALPTFLVERLSGGVKSG